METQSEIVDGLNARFDTVAIWFDQRPDTSFCSGPGERWTEGQHLDHLIKSTKPLNLALRLPRIALRLKFGTASGPGESIEAVVERYESVLAGGGKASGRFVPPEVRLEDKGDLIDSFRHEGKRLVEAVGQWSESDLDKYVLPHPLLGNLTVREMLFFTYHHMGHHLETLARDYGAA